MSTRRNPVIIIIGLVGCLILGVSAYLLWPSQQLAASAVRNPSSAVQDQVLGMPSNSRLSSQSADPTPPLRPQVGSGSSSVYKYNAQSQLTAIVYSDGSVYTYRYDAHGDKITETSRSGQRWDYQSDGSHQSTASVDPKNAIPRIKQPSNTASEQK